MLKHRDIGVGNGVSHPVCDDMKGPFSLFVSMTGYRKIGFCCLHVIFGGSEYVVKWWMQRVSSLDKKRPKVLSLGHVLRNKSLQLNCTGLTIDEEDVDICIGAGFVKKRDTSFYHTVSTLISYIAISSSNHLSV